jgi:hypothetical protein
MEESAMETEDEGSFWIQRRQKDDFFSHYSIGGVLGK